jgi:hypothetical protein
MPKTDNPKFNSDIFFFKDFGAHIQVNSGDIDELKLDLANVVDYLNELGAVPRNSDAPYKPYVAQTSTGTGETDQSPMEAAAEATFGVQKLCPNDGNVMKFSPGGVSRSKTNADGSPKKFNSRYACAACQLTVWNKN